MTTIPEGWKLVPVATGHFTSEMERAGCRVLDKDPDAIPEAFRAMCAASPAAPEGAAEGCTPADVRVLREANLALAVESCRLQEALRWYADGNHLLGTDRWESVSGEPENWLASPNMNDTAMVEDGFTAREALAPFDLAAPPAQTPAPPQKDLLAVGRDGLQHDAGGARSSPDAVPSTTEEKP